MCLAVPVKIIDIDKENKTATGEIGGVKRKVQISFLKDLKKNDYVLLHAGFAIEKINKKEAEETLLLFEKIKSLS